MEEQNFYQSTPTSGNSPTSSNSPQSKSKGKNRIIIGLIVVVLIIIYFILPNPNKELLKNNLENVYKPMTASASKFATYEEVPVNVNPKVPAYTINKDFSNIINYSDFTFSEAAKNLLVQNNFVVIPTQYYKEFYQLYESNSYNYHPSFITTDSMLHNYHLMFDFLLKQLEEQRLSTVLKQISNSMLNEAVNQYDILKGTEWENAAKREVGFFAVGSKLLDPSTNVPSIVANEVNQELTLIQTHQGIQKSPVMNIGLEENTTTNASEDNSQLAEALEEDYSQYVPRGHYDKSDQLKAYFKAMTWYGRLTFRMKNEDEIKSAILITLALNNENNFKNWEKIYEPVNFFVGKSDDINYYQFKDLIDKVYGADATALSVAKDNSKFSSFVNAVNSLEPPQINSMPIAQTANQEAKNKEIKGFRFMGQRFTIDASIFQNLIYSAVGDKTKSCAEFKPEETSCLSGARCLPKGLDIPATMGSQEAKNILTEMGETQYACYSENMSKVQSYLASLSNETWTQNLYWGWLYQLRPLLETKGNGYPVFMQNAAWQRKDLNTFLGSWTELKHDTILYSKQVYAEMGGGEEEKKDDRGYVEPNPHVYARLASLLKMTSEGLQIRGLLSDSLKENLGKLEDLALSLKTISEKELNNENLTADEYNLIRSYGGQLEHFWLEVNKDEPQFKESTSQRDYLDENPAAIIVDVATDPNGKVLEEGTGKISEIFVVVPVEGKLRIARGGVYSYYEFIQPINNRLNDKQWRDLLNSNQAPDLPSWTDTFTAIMNKMNVEKN